MDLLSKLLKHMVTIGASDLILSPGRPPAFRVRGSLLPPEGSALTPERLERMARLIMLEDQFQRFEQNPEINLGFTLPGIGRFRFNVFRQRRAIGMVARAIPDAIPDFATLGLPEVLKDIARQRSGLVLVVGPAGSGKSTTLAALVEHRSSHDLSHVITLEDPIEYLFKHHDSVINQREIGADSLSYAAGLMNALRQSPDVIMIGEVREAAIMERILEFADTGHLCLSTLHANSVTKALERITKMFPEEAREQARVALAQNLRAILSQRLVPTHDGQQTVACELLVASARVSDLIQRGEFSALDEVMEKDDSMRTLDHSLFDLYQSGRVTKDTALLHASSAGNMRLRMRLHQAAAPSGAIVI